MEVRVGAGEGGAGGGEAGVVYRVGLNLVRVLPAVQQPAHQVGTCAGGGGGGGDAIQADACTP
eukprot:326150-Chlamydomonas_euryale.AAC.5